MHHSTTKKRNISDIESDSEIKTPTKKSRPLAQLPLRGRGAGRHQQRRQSTSPITPPKGPRKRTNERPGHLIKKKRRTKEEIAADLAAKEAKEKAEAKAKANAVTDLVNMELDQEQEEAMRRQHVLRRQPSYLDVPAPKLASTCSSGSEDFNLDAIDSTDDSDDSEMDGDGGVDRVVASELSDGSVATVKKTKVSANSKLLISLNNRMHQ
jgi:hypothetical protein